MDILNWLYLRKQQLIKTEVNDASTDLLVLGAEVPFTTRGDGYQTYSMTVSDFGLQSRPYKNYMALITQSNTDIPEITVLENTLDITGVFEYDIPGEYFITFDKVLFSSPEAYVTIKGNTTIINGDLGVITATPVFFDVVGVFSYINGVSADNVIGNGTPCILEIRLY